MNNVDIKRLEERLAKAKSLPAHEQEKWKYEIGKLKIEIEKLVSQASKIPIAPKDAVDMLYTFIGDWKPIWPDWISEELKHYPKLLQEVKDSLAGMHACAKTKDTVEFIAYAKRYKLINDEIQEKLMDEKYERIGLKRTFDPSPWEQQKLIG